MAEKIIVKQIRSRIGAKPKQRSTLTALGLRKVGAERQHDDNSVIRGMINKVRHLVDVMEISE